MEKYAMPFIYSTLTCSNTFVLYAPKSDPHALSRVVKRIEIHGGHGMKNPKALDTPRGVVTRVSDEELELLQQSSSFKRQVAAGFIVVDKKEVDPAKKAADMAEKDASAPLTPDDFVKSEDSTDEIALYKNKKKGK